jgi:hypothetical protein
MQTYLVIAIIDSTQVIRLMLAWSPSDAERRARYMWRDSTITNLEVNAALDIIVPEDFEP